MYEGHPEGKSRNTPTVGPVRRYPSKWTRPRVYKTEFPTLIIYLSLIIYAMLSDVNPHYLYLKEHIPGWDATEHIGQNKGKETKEKTKERGQR